MKKINYVYDGYDIDREGTYYSIPKTGIEIMPVDGRKSFYDKAYALRFYDHFNNTNVLCLYSYETCVYIYDIDNDYIVRNDYHKWSRTTDRHIRSFCDRYNLSYE